METIHEELQALLHAYLVNVGNEQQLVNDLLVDRDSISRWLHGTNLPHPTIIPPLINFLKSKLQHLQKENVSEQDDPVFATPKNQQEKSDTFASEHDKEVIKGNEQDDVVFTISKDQQEKFHAFVAEHDKECPLPPGYHGFIDSSKYVYRFRGTSVGPVIQLVCDCGKELEIHPLDNENL